MMILDISFTFCWRRSGIPNVDKSVFELNTLDDRHYNLLVKEARP